MNEGAAARYRLTDGEANVARVDLTDLVEAEASLRKLRENKDVKKDLELAAQLTEVRDKKPKKGDTEEEESKDKDKDKDKDASADEEDLEEDEDA